MICVAYLSVACSGNGYTVKDVEQGVRVGQTVVGVIEEVPHVVQTVESPAKTVVSLINAPGTVVSKLKRSLPVTFIQPHGSYTYTNKGCVFGGLECFHKGSQHTGIDSKGDSKIISSAPGIINVVMMNGKPGKNAKPCSKKGCGNEKGDGSCADHGLGNTIIVEHWLDPDGAEKVYSMYSHLAEIDSTVKEGMCIDQSRPLGLMGGTGYGKENCWVKHLHFEIKKYPALGSGKAGNLQEGGSIFGYADSWVNLLDHGFFNPDDYVGKKQAYIPNEKICPLLE
jgi:murein DD-endopeptidase MepM/ murein hydrolase activator NlpD